MTAPTHVRALDGIRVIDFTTVMAGPYCTRVLADLGAEVIKVESPGGDVTRAAEPMRGGRSAYFAQFNSGKRSVVLDLRDEAARRAARALIDSADVVVENMRVGVMARFGLDHATVSADRPGLVYCSISGFGQDAADAGRPATAQIVHAVTGYDLAFCAYQPGEPPPPAAGLFVADGMAGALAVSGILAALRVRDATGEGRHVDVALDRSLLSMLPYEMQAAQFDPGFVRKGYRAVRARDGYVMAAAVTQQNFRGLCAAMERPDLLTDERFAAVSARWRTYDELHAEIEQWSGERTADECEQTLRANGVPATRYRTVPEYLDQPGVRERLTTVAKDDVGELRVSRLPFRLSGGSSEPDPEAPLPVPALGEHTRDLLIDIIGAEATDRVVSGAGGASADRAPKE